MSGDLLLGTAGDATGGDPVPSGSGDGVLTQPAAAPVRVLICDDHEVLRHGLRTVLLRAGIRYIEVAAPLSKRRLHLDAFLNEELRAAAP